VLAEPDERLVDVVHGKHDAEVAKTRSLGRSGDRRPQEA
jgi:hypothetical protein